MTDFLAYIIGSAIALGANVASGVEYEFKCENVLDCGFYKVFEVSKEYKDQATEPENKEQKDK